MNQLKYTKWYWYIPLLGIIFFNSMERWMGEGDSLKNCEKRLLIITLIIGYNVMLSATILIRLFVLK